MDADELLAWLTLLALPRAGPATLLPLLHEVPSALRALQLEPARLAAIELHPDTRSALHALQGRPDPRHTRVRDWLLENGVQALAIHDPRYPELLRQTARAPPLLFVRGDVGVLHVPQLAMVGSRHPTHAGLELAAEIAARLSGYGLAITSGLALGIDTASHCGAVDAGGRSIAVMGTGPDRVYPTRNRRLAARIVAEGGALVTEFAPGTGPEAANFPRRNRVISALALGVLVVEAAQPSGSLLTAQHAAEQGREVLAVPGPVRSPTSRGCHALLRQGAALVESAEDVLIALGDRFRPATTPAAVPAGQEPERPALEDTERRVLHASGYERTSIDTLIARTGLDAAQVGSILTRLELRGLVRRDAGGYMRAG
jgi:DNA processing protein